MLRSPWRLLLVESRGDHRLDAPRLATFTMKRMNKLLFCVLAGWAAAAFAAGPAKTIEIAMDDSMRFTPSQVEAAAGETVRFAVRNKGKLEHEFVVGTDKQVEEHAKAMQDHSHHAHRNTSSLTLAPGAKGELVMKFDKPQVLQMACFVPGHYEAGMRGTVTVTQRIKP